MSDGEFNDLIYKSKIHWPQEKVRRKEIPAHNENEINDCQLPIEALPLGTSFEVMSKVSMNPLVPLNS
jgi:hypothetical protein